MNKMPDWLKSGIVFGLIFVLGTVFTSGKFIGSSETSTSQLDKEIGEVRDAFSSHLAWSEKRNDVLITNERELAVFKAEVVNLKAAVVDLTIALKEFRVDMNQDKRLSRK